MDQLLHQLHLLHFPDDFITKLKEKISLIVLLHYTLVEGLFCLSVIKTWISHKMHSEYAEVDENSASQICETIKKEEKL